MDVWMKFSLMLIYLLIEDGQLKPIKNETHPKIHPINASILVTSTESSPTASVESVETAIQALHSTKQGCKLQKVYCTPTYCLASWE